jgi:hypothetical protein
VTGLGQVSKYFEQPSYSGRRRVPTRTTVPEKQPMGFFINPYLRFEALHPIRVQPSQASVSNDVTEGLERAYVIENHAAVAGFILNNRLHGLLLDAVAPLNGTFGEGAIKVLTLVTDDEGSENLYCLIMTPGDINAAREQLRTFDEEWWIVHSAMSAGKLNFDIELI